MTPEIVVDLRSALPPYEQIRSQVAGFIGVGMLRPGDRLPTIRDLAGQLGIAGNTVGRAYRELESAGLVTTRRRSGTVVTAGMTSLSADMRRSATTFADYARRDGLSEDMAVDLVRAAYRHASG